jgi:hypothetical protein
LRNPASQYCTDAEFTSDRPFYFDEPTIATAVYATLAEPGQVDHFTLAGRAAEPFSLTIAIPRLRGQEDFAPMLALIGPGLPLTDEGLPAGVRVPEGEGVLVYPPPAEPAGVFDEPLTRTSYWRRQQARVTLPTDREYSLVVWSPESDVGRYVLTVGDSERLGGDPLFPFKLIGYWRPVARSRRRRQKPTPGWMASTPTRWTWTPCAKAPSGAFWPCGSRATETNTMFLNHCHVFPYGAFPDQRTRDCFVDDDKLARTTDQHRPFISFVAFAL